MSEAIVQRTIKLYEEARDIKSQYHSLFDDLARVQLPSKMGFSTTVVEGERRTEDIFDGTPMQAARGLANAVGGMLRPQGIPEAEMKAEDDVLDNMSEVQDWIYDAQEKLKKAFNNPRARFRQASGESDKDLVVFGFSNMFEGENNRRNSLIFQSHHPKDAVPVFNEEGAPDGMFVKRRIPIRWIVERFGEQSLHENTRKKLEQDKREEKIEILRAVLPRKDFKKDAIFSRNMLFSDIWIEVNEKHLLATGGFHEFPYIVPRWDTSSGEPFGQSPGMIALPDSDTLQAMGETILISGQRSADPPLAVPNDGAFDAINTFPGGLSYYDVETAVSVRGNPFFPIENGANLPITRDMQQDSRSQVWAAFFRNILNLPLQGPQMTATEVIQRKEEFIREIGPVFGRLETDYTAPMVERAFMILLRAGQFLPIPKALQGRDIRFEYDSPVNRIRKQIEAAAARQWALEQIEIGQIRPEAIDLVNVDELGRFSAEALGIPRKIVNPEDVVENIRVQRQQLQQAQVQAMAVKESAEVLKTGAEAADKAGLVQRETQAA